MNEISAYQLSLFIGISHQIHEFVSSDSHVQISKHIEIETDSFQNLSYSNKTSSNRTISFMKSKKKRTHNTNRWMEPLGRKKLKMLTELNAYHISFHLVAGYLIAFYSPPSHSQNVSLFNWTFCVSRINNSEMYFRPTLLLISIWQHKIWTKKKRKNKPSIPTVKNSAQTITHFSGDRDEEKLISKLPIYYPEARKWTGKKFQFHQKVSKKLKAKWTNSCNSIASVDFLTSMWNTMYQPCLWHACYSERKRREREWAIETGCAQNYVLDERWKLF